MSEKLEMKKKFSRRTVVKGAAWSVPVVATAVAAPAYAATVTWNGAVAGFCTGNYDLSILRNIVGSTLTGTVKAALALIGLTDGAARGFTISATTTQPIPAGTVYRLTAPAGLINLVALQGLISASVLGVVQVNATTYDFVLNAPIVQGSPVTIDLYGALVDAGVASSFTLQQVDPDANALDNSGSTSSLVAAKIDLGDLGIPGVRGSLTVQLCGA